MSNNNRAEVREFLISRRARLTPAQVGLPEGSGSRRVAGLRRGEVAQLAGLSVEYYTQLERGSISGASDGVLDALSSALRFDESERAHLFDLARAATKGRKLPNRVATTRIRPAIQQILDAQLSPAWVIDGRGDLLATNALGRALNAPMYQASEGPVNVARFRFFDPRSREYFNDWAQAGADIVATLRAEAARRPYDKPLTDLIGELSTRSEEFRQRWATHDVRGHRSGRKRLHHPVVGDLELSYEGLELTADPGLVMYIYTADPGSPSDHALRLLASWAVELSSTPAQTS